MPEGLLEVAVEAALAPYGIDVQHPDSFLCNHFKLAPGVILTAVRKVRARLKTPPYSTGKYLAGPKGSLWRA